jgi:hypothetical protein
LKLSYEQLAFLSYNSIYSVDTSHVKVKQMWVKRTTKWKC